MARSWTACTLTAISLALLGAAGGNAHPPKLDLRRVNWLDATLPRAVCGATGRVRLKSGDAIVHSSRWPHWPQVHLTDNWSAKPVTYGKLSGQDAAAVSVNCNNGGGTADGVLAYAQAIFRAGSHAPQLIGLITPRVQPRNEPATLVGASFAGTQIVAHEFFYSPGEGICCPSGRATSIWRYSKGRLVYVHTVVTKRP